MLLDYYRQYVRATRKVKEVTIEKYVGALKVCNDVLRRNDFPIENIFDITNIRELDGALNVLMNDKEFVAKDNIGHHMYSAAFKHFYSFAQAENFELKEKSLEVMDIVVDVSKQYISSTNGWKRNQILITQAIEGANHLCENNNEHTTFTAKSTGKAYMEGHHLIPMKYQSQFKHGIDVYANIVCLCPICHRLLHYGAANEKVYAAEKLFDERKHRLIKSGIDISKNDFLEIVL